MTIIYDFTKYNYFHRPAGDEHGGEFAPRVHPEGYSAQAWIDAAGVIHTDNVYDAQLALFHNSRVELDQPRGLSTLIKQLGLTSQDMIDRGEIPHFDLCKVTIKGTNLLCADSKGIPRVQMPQLNKQQTRDFRSYLQDKGYTVAKEEALSSHLRATQNQLNGTGVARQADRIRRENGLSQRIIVSNDDYILDGHHRWAAKLGLDSADNNLENDNRIGISRVNISITKLLEEADTFTGGKGKKGVLTYKYNIHHKPAGDEHGGEFATSGDDHAARVAARAKLTEEMTRLQKDGILKPLSKDEEESVTHYTGGGFSGINNRLRDDINATAFQDYIDNIDSAIGKTALPKDVTVYRGIGQTLSAQLEKSLKKGDAVFTDKAFVSTSLREGQAGAFSKNTMEIKLPKGMHALPVGDKYSSSPEHEILLPRGSRFKVTSIKKTHVDRSFNPVGSDYIRYKAELVSK